jgi:hypothetical protein
MPQNQKTITIGSFSGLDNVNRPEKTGQGFLKVAENIDIDKVGGIHKRTGYVLVSEGNYNSLWSYGDSMYVVKDNNLIRIHSDYSEEILLESVGSSKISFEEIDGKIYFSNENINGIIDNGVVRGWGISRPNPTPTLSSTNGLLTAGVYQVNITYVSIDGRESGCGPARSITLGDSSGIHLTNIPTSPDATIASIRIYCSPADGDILYWIKDVPNGTSSATITDVSSGVFPLKTFNLMEAPKGQLVKYFAGRIYIVDGNVLWYSEPFSYEQFNFQGGFKQFTQFNVIKALMPVEDGVYIATVDKLYYASGRDPDKWNLDFKEQASIIPGTEQIIQGAFALIQNTPLGYKWLITTDKGVLALFQDGVVINLTYKNVAYPKAPQGGSVVLERNGMNHYLTTLKARDAFQNIGASDLVTATVIRNGIAIP